MNPSLTFATAGRVLTQLRRDHRTLGMIIVIPCLLVTLIKYVVGDDTWGAHLAACRGVPTTIHLPMKADWLWGPRRDGPSPWYPALELKFV